MKKLIEKYDYIKICPIGNDGMKYLLIREIVYWSARYKRYIKCESGMKSDGATGIPDLKGSTSWWVHDKLCNNACWDDGSPISNWQCSRVLGDILKLEGHGFRARTWLVGTFLGGGWKIKRRNGWFFSWRNSQYMPS